MTKKKVRKWFLDTYQIKNSLLNYLLGGRVIFNVINYIQYEILMLNLWNKKFMEIQIGEKLNVFKTYYANFYRNEF